MEANKSWPTLLEPILAKSTPIKKVINASISGDTTGNALDRLPKLLDQHKPTWILLELGANDGLRGFNPNIVKNNLLKLIELSKQKNSKPLLMQIQIPPNYGSRYSKTFANLYPKISQDENVPLLPFFMEKVVLTEGWMMQDGLHPTEDAQPWIAQYVGDEIKKILKKNVKA